MSRYNKFFNQLEQTINKSMSGTPRTANSAGAATLEEMVKSLDTRVSQLTEMLSPEGPIAKTIKKVEEDQGTIGEAVEKSLDRIEIVEKSGARPHSAAGDNAGTAAAVAAKTEEVNKAAGVNTEWDSMFRHLRAGGKVALR